MMIVHTSIKRSSYTIVHLPKILPLIESPLGSRSVLNVGVCRVTHCLTWIKKSKLMQLIRTGTLLENVCFFIGGRNYIPKILSMTSS